MRQNRPLAEALREAARRIEDPSTRYSWSLVTRCNCGILAQVVMDLDQDELLMRVARDVPGDWIEGYWSELSNQYACPITSLRMGTVLRTLGDLGMDWSDLAHLEMTDSPEVLKACGWNRGDDTYGSRDSVVRYMRAWADLLDPPAVLEHKPERQAAMQEA